MTTREIQGHLEEMYGIEVSPTLISNVTITQVTNSGKAAETAISPDGRYVLIVKDESGLQSLWLRNVLTGSDTQVIPPSVSRYASLAFSPDGNYIYFRKAQNAIEDSYNLYRSPILGGTPKTVVQKIDTDIAFSPDGQHIAYIRTNDPEVGKYSILTASLEGDNETVLQTRSAGDVPFSLAWSPSGSELAYSVRGHEQELFATIEILNFRTGKSHRLAIPKGKYPWDIRWSPDGQTLFARYTQMGVNFHRSQIGFVRITGGDIEPITRDANNYWAHTLSADGETIATVQGRSYATISVLSKVGREFKELRSLPSRVNEFDPWSSVLNWSADGDLLVSNAGRLLRLGGDGKSQTQLLADSSAIMNNPSPCGANYLVLSWPYHGGIKSANIWRANADGSSPVKLTNGISDDVPVCSPDQKWVYYIDYRGRCISRVRLDGSGTTEAIFSMPQGYFPESDYLSVSSDGKTLAIAVGAAPAGVVKIALFELGSPSPPRMLDASRYSGGVQFTPDGKSIAYAIRESGVDNVWIQPLDGSAAYPITDFKSEQIWSFHLSPDGKNLGILHGHYDSDVVLLQESKP
jgi:Tol biopolymer transport system component